MRQPFVRTLDKSGGGNYSTGKNAVGICHRSGFKVPYRELVFEPGTNFLVHKSETDGNYSLINHPQNYPPEDVTDRISLKWAFPDVALSVGAITCAGELGRTYSLSYEEGIHLDFKTANYYTRTSQGIVYSADLATFLNYNRSGIASYVAPEGIIKYVGPNEPRIEYSPTGAFLGLLVEASTANICLQSAALGTTPWQVSNISVTNNSATAPDGTLTASLMTENSATSTHVVYQGINTTADVPYTSSFWVKPNGRTSCYVQMKDQAAGNKGFACHFTLSGAGSLGSTQTLGDGQFLSATITNYPDGWYFITMSGKFGVGVTANLLSIFTTTAGETVSFTGDGVSGLYLWGVQIEQRKYRTSYIPTTTAIRSRSNDFCRVLLNPSLYSTEHGTLHADVIPAVASVTGTNQFFVHMSPKNYTDTINIGEQNGRYGLVVNKGGAFNGNATVSVKFTANVSAHIAGTWEDNNLIAVRNGAETAVDTIASVPTTELDTFQIGSDHNGFNNCIRTYFQRINYWPYMLSQSELIALTSVG